MSAVYSTNFARGGPFSAGSHVVYNVPDGYRAVIRDMVMTFNGLWTDTLNGFQVFGRFPTTTIWEVKNPFARGAKTYHWEGRTILDPTGEIIVNAYDLGWEGSIDGYLLSLP